MSAQGTQGMIFECSNFKNILVNLKASFIFREAAAANNSIEIEISITEAEHIINIEAVKIFATLSHIQVCESRMNY